MVCIVYVSIVPNLMKEAKYRDKALALYKSA